MSYKMRPMARSPRVLNEIQVKGIIFQTVLGNIVNEPVDAIVNAANGYLAHGGGVAGAISDAAGEEMDEESSAYVRKYGKVKTGRVAVTGPGDIPVRCIIHAVGPVYRGRAKESDKLYNACFNTFAKAHELEMKSLSIPAVSSGIFGFPKDRCAIIMISAALDFSEQVGETTLRLIRFANFDMETAEVFNFGLQSLKDNKFERFVVNPQFKDLQGLGKPDNSFDINKDATVGQNEEFKQEVDLKCSQNMEIDDESSSRKTDEETKQDHANPDEESKEEVHPQESNNP